MNKIQRGANRIVQYFWLLASLGCLGICIRELIKQQFGNNLITFAIFCFVCLYFFNVHRKRLNSHNNN